MKLLMAGLLFAQQRAVTPVYGWFSEASAHWISEYSDISPLGTCCRADAE
jgi:hypothetical protein